MEAVKHSKCCYCGRKFSTENKNLQMTKDHFIPSSRTGNNEDNILYACHECNQWKADKMPEFWLQRVEYLERKRSLYRSYTLFDYRQIIGSVRHWIKYFKGKNISDYKFKK